MLCQYTHPTLCLSDSKQFALHRLLSSESQSEVESKPGLAPPPFYNITSNFLYIDGYYEIKFIDIVEDET